MALKASIAESLKWLEGARSSSIVQQVIRFGLSTLLSAAMSFGIPIILVQTLSIAPPLAVAVGFITAYTVNLLLLRLFVFRSANPIQHDIVRYVCTNALFRGLEYLSFLGLFVFFRIDYSRSLLTVLVVSSLLKFFAYRRVFKG